MFSTGYLILSNFSYNCDRHRVSCLIFKKERPNHTTSNSLQTVMCWVYIGSYWVTLIWTLSKYAMIFFAKLPSFSFFWYIYKSALDIWTCLVLSLAMIRFGVGTDCVILKKQRTTSSGVLNAKKRRSTQQPRKTLTAAAAPGVERSV